MFGIFEGGRFTVYQNPDIGLLYRGGEGGRGAKGNGVDLIWDLTGWC